MPPRCLPLYLKNPGTAHALKCIVLQKAGNRICVPRARRGVQRGIHIVHFHAPRVETSRNRQLSALPPHPGAFTLM